MPKMLRLQFIVLIKAFILVGCITNSSSTSNDPSRFSYTVGLPSYAPQAIKQNLAIAVQYWNKALFTNALKIVPYEKALVKVQYEFASRLDEFKGHQNKVGCLGPANILKICQMMVKIPSPQLLEIDLNPLMDVTIYGKFDDFLKKHFHSLDSKSYMAKKLAVMGMIHELGHILGLGHQVRPDCMMSPSLYGNKHVCKQSILEARKRLRTLRFPDLDKP